MCKTEATMYTLLTVLVIVGVSILYKIHERDNKLMADCMQDHKEYECVGILHGRR